MPWFGLSVALNAFLLFTLQPLLGKALLPWFGGVAAVWTTCMLFFQVLLLLAYGWAHGLQRLAPRQQVLVHAGLLATAALALCWGASVWGAPLLPDASWRPEDSSLPVWRALKILIVAAGVPTLAIAATGPLVQSWFARARPGVPPWRLYALSNGGSLVGLAAYPLVIEPWFPLHRQAWIWLTLFAIAVLAVVASGSSLLGQRDCPDRLIANRLEVQPQVVWVLLAALPSLLLLAVTNHLCQDVAPIPLLWVVPLALYLLSMILCFESDRWYRPSRYVPLTAILLLLSESLRLMWAPEVAQVLAFAALLFSGGMVCHGVSPGGVLPSTA